MALLTSIAAIVVVGTVVHEYAHWSMGHVLGLSPSGPYWTPVLIPHVDYGVTEHSWKLTVAWLAGGIASGVLLLATYLFLYRWKGNESCGRLLWTVGLILAGWSSLQIGVGFMEGLYRDAYINGDLAYAKFLCLAIRRRTPRIYHAMASRTIPQALTGYTSTARWVNLTSAASASPLQPIALASPRRSHPTAARWGCLGCDCAYNSCDQAEVRHGRNNAEHLVRP